MSIPEIDRRIDHRIDNRIDNRAEVDIFSTSGGGGGGGPSATALTYNGNELLYIGQTLEYTV